MFKKSYLAALALVGASTLALAAGGCGGKSPEQRAEWMARKITKKLDLTDPQKAQLAAVKDTWLRLRKDRVAQREKTHDDVRQLILAEKFDQGKALNLFKSHQEDHAQMAPELIAKIATFHDGLSPDQKKLAVEMIDQFKKRYSKE